MTFWNVLQTLLRNSPWPFEHPARGGMGKKMIWVEDLQHVIQIQSVQAFIVVSRKPGLDVLRHSLSSGAHMACLDQQSYFLCLLLARRFETASCHKCALSLLALALIEISLATCREPLHVSRLWKLVTVWFGGLTRRPEKLIPVVSEPWPLLMWEVFKKNKKQKLPLSSCRWSASCSRRSRTR